jgi:signal transduction histidine kinase
MTAAGTVALAHPRQPVRDGDQLLLAVASAARELLAGADIHDSIRAAAALLGPALGLVRVATAEDVPAPGDQRPGSWRIAHEWHAPHVPAQMGSPAQTGTYLSMDVWQRARRGETFALKLADTDGTFAQGQIAIGSRSILTVPIFVGNRWWGALAFDDSTPRDWAAHEVSVLQTAASCVGAALLRHESVEERIAAQRLHAEESARHIVRLKRHSELLDAVARAAEKLLVAHEPARVLNEVLAHVGQVTRAERACLARTDWTPADPDVLGWQEIVHEWTRPGAQPQIGGELARFAMRRDDATWERMLGQFQSEHRAVSRVDEQDEPYRSEQLALGVAWGICLPVVVDSVIWGLVGMDFATPFEDYEEADLAALQTVASTIAHGIARQRLEQRTLQAERARADESARLFNLLEVMASTSRQLLNAADFEPALLQWLGAFGSASDAMRATYSDFVLNGESGLMTKRMLTEWARLGVQGNIPCSFAQPHVIDPRGEEHLMARLTAGQKMAFHTDEMLGAAREGMERQGIASTLCAPIFRAGRLWGCLSFDYASRRDLDHGDVVVLQAAADTLAAILNSNAEAERAVTEREARIVAEQNRFSELVRANEALRASLDALSDGANEEGFRRQALTEIVKQAGAQSAYLFGSDGPQDLLRVVASLSQGSYHPRGLPEDPPMFRRGLSLSRCFLDQIAPRGRLWHGEETVAENDPDTRGVIRWRLAMGYSSHSVHALCIGERVVGMVCLLFGEDGSLTDSRLELVHAMCQPLALALELGRQANVARATAERTAALAERERIAGEIHDSLAQSFTSIAMQSESLAEKLGDETPYARVLRMIERTAREGLAEARASVLALNPVDGTPGALSRALAELAERCNVQGRVHCRFEASGAPCALSATVRQSLLRIAQEASSNALRHSGGNELLLRLEYAQPSVRLTVSDNGLGHLAEVDARHHGGFGIAGMTARAAAIGGTLSLRPSERGGLAVCVQCPCVGTDKESP